MPPHETQRAGTVSQIFAQLPNNSKNAKLRTE